MTYSEARGERGQTHRKHCWTTLTSKASCQNQFGRENKHFVLCNNSGEWLCAARLEGNDIVYDSLYVVETKSTDEALFLTALLNSDALQPAYQSTKRRTGTLPLISGARFRCRAITARTRAQGSGNACRRSGGSGGRDGGAKKGIHQGGAPPNGSECQDGCHRAGDVP